MALAGVLMAISASAIVEVTVRVDVGSAWGSDCSVEQVHSQGAREAVAHLERLFQKERNITVVGKPKVTAIMRTREG